MVHGGKEIRDDGPHSSQLKKTKHTELRLSNKCTLYIIYFSLKEKDKQINLALRRMKKINATISMPRPANPAEELSEQQSLKITEQKLK